MKESRRLEAATSVDSVHREVWLYDASLKLMIWRHASTRGAAQSMTYHLLSIRDNETHFEAAGGVSLSSSCMAWGVLSLSACRG